MRRGLPGVGEEFSAAGRLLRLLFSSPRAASPQEISSIPAMNAAGSCFCRFVPIVRAIEGIAGCSSARGSQKRWLSRERSIPDSVRYGEKPYFVDQSHHTSHTYDPAIKNKVWLGSKKLPWETDVPIKDIDPLTTEDPKCLLFFNFSRSFRDGSRSFFSWLAGRYDAAGHVYFKEDIPTQETRRGRRSKDHKENILKFLDKDIMTLVPWKYHSNFVNHEKLMENSPLYYNDYEDDEATYDWPDRVVEILFAENEANLAYYLKLMIRYSYVAKTRERLWAWRCGDDRGILRLIRMLSGRVYTIHAQSQMVKLCRELNSLELWTFPDGAPWRGDHWFTGFFETAGRFRYDIPRQKPYISFLWRDTAVLKAISSVFGPGVIRRYRPPEAGKRSLDYNVDIFNDYECSTLTDIVNLPKGGMRPTVVPTGQDSEPPEKDIFDLWWDKKSPHRSMGSPEFHLRGQYRKTPGDTSMKDLSFEDNIKLCEDYIKSRNLPSRSKVLFELVIDNMEGMSKISTHFTFKRSRGFTSRFYKFWHKTMIGDNVKYYGDYVNRSGLNTLSSCAYYVSVFYEDINLNTILLKRSLPYKSLYDCRAEDDTVWIEQSNEEMLARTVNLPLNTPCHPMSKHYDVKLDRSKISYLPRHIYKKTNKSIATAEKFYFREMEVDTDPIGLKGLMRIVAESTPAPQLIQSKDK